MKSLKWLLSLSMAAVLPALAQPPSPQLPPDIDEQSYSRLPLILKETLDAEGRRVFEAINGNASNTPRLGPPASSLYSVAAAEPYDRLNQVLRNANVIGPQFFEISEITMVMGDYAMTAMLLNAVNQQLPSDWEPLLPMP